MRLEGPRWPAVGMVIGMVVGVSMFGPPATTDEERAAILEQLKDLRKTQKALEQCEANRR